jgi:hypothetical protein
MSVSLYMDENVPHQITVGFRLRCIDVLSEQEVHNLVVKFYGRNPQSY